MSKPNLPPRVPGCSGRDTRFTTPDGRRLWARVCDFECTVHDCSEDELCNCTTYYCPRCECPEQWAFLYQTPFPDLFVCLDCLDAEPLFHERFDSYAPDAEPDSYVPEP